MKVTKIGDRYQVRVEELLPCKDFICYHESMACATVIWCPEGCFDSNHYVGVCIPKCTDCVNYINGTCKRWREFKDQENHSALSGYEK